MPSIRTQTHTSTHRLLDTVGYSGAVGVDVPVADDRVGSVGAGFAVVGRTDDPATSSPSRALPPARQSPVTAAWTLSTRTRAGPSHIDLSR